MKNGFNFLGPISILADGNDEKWTKILEDFVNKTGKEYLYSCEMMKSGAYKEHQHSK